MRKTTDHFASLASCTAFGDDGDGAHVDNLLVLFFTVNARLKQIIAYFPCLSSIFLECWKIIMTVEGISFSVENYSKLDELFLSSVVIQTILYSAE